MTESYSEIEIRIRGREGEGPYPVEAKLDDGSGSEDGTLDLDRQRLLLAELDPQAYGLALFGALFAGPIRDDLNRALGRAKERTEGRLRVRLRIDAAAPELHALPWERLYHVHRGRLIPLTTSSLTPFSRYTRLQIGEPEPLRERPLRLLAVLANPRGLPSALTPVDVDREARNLGAALSDLQRQGQVRVTLLPGISGVSAALKQELEQEGFRVAEGASSLNRILRLMKDCHVLHFVGHGWFRDGAGALHLEGEDGAWEPVKDGDLVPRLAALDPQPRLVFLNACESATRTGEEQHPFVGLGPMLVRAGIPAVVAMQDLVPMDLARELAHDFYRGLLAHGFVDLALNEARNLLFEAEDTDWAIPVLFMRLRGGRLFVADPVLGALEAVQRQSRDERVPIPVEVLHLRGRQDPGALELLEQRSAPAVDLLQAVDVVFRLEQLLESLPGVMKKAMKLVVGRGQRQARLVVLVGSQGATKTTQLRRIAHATAAASLAASAGRRVVPVVVDLRALASERRGLHNPVETLALKALRDLWPGLAARSFSELARDHPGVILRLLLDGTDHLPDRERREAWEQVQELAAGAPSHDYLLGVDSVHFDPANLKRATDLLVMQPLSRRAVKRFLEGQPDPAGDRLYEALKSAEMFDLASLPWLLATMLEQTRRGSYPQSRSKVLEELVEDALAEIPTRRGMRSRAEQTLAAMAWQMHREIAHHWPVERAFRTMAEVRGNREYSLEELFDGLVECGLLARLGHDAVRFAHPAVRDYCCARAIAELDHEDRDRVLDDVTASLGRPTRLLWWQGVLVLLSGLLRNPNVLIRMLLHGETLSEGEQVFVAARCLQEAKSRPGAREISPKLVNQVIDALVWRLRIENVRITARRERAAEVLGRLGMPETIPYLARVANQKVRTDWQGEPTHDFSSMRMAASRALRRMVPRYAEQVAAADPMLARLLELWRRGEREELAEWLRSGDADSRPIAAFALADLYTDETPKPLEDLISAFLDRAAKGATRWAVADALTRLDPNTVKERAILPFLDQEAGLDPEAWKRRADWYRHLAYLIGKIRVQDPTTRAFLARCLFELKDVGVKAKAIQSLGWLQDPSYKDPFEQIALGELGALALSDKATDEDKVYLRRKTIEALGSIGDRDTLTRLREARSDWHPDLDRAFFWASEEISWRSSLASGARR